MENSLNNSRREVLIQTGKAGIAARLSVTALSSFAGNYSAAGNFFGAEEIPYEQQPLPYTYTALESVIDAMTMELHYSKRCGCLCQKSCRSC